MLRYDRLRRYDHKGVFNKPLHFIAGLQVVPSRPKVAMRAFGATRFGLA
jgi:hypothetical protein